MLGCRFRLLRGAGTFDALEKSGKTDRPPANTPNFIHFGATFKFQEKYEQNQCDMSWRA